MATGTATGPSAIRERLSPLWLFEMACWAVFVYSLGRWGFWDLLGLKRPVQVILFVAVLPLIMISFGRLPSLWRHPLFLMAGLFAVFEVMMRGDPLGMAEYVIAAAGVAAVATVPLRYAEWCMRYTVAVGAIFATLAILLFFVLVADPEFSYLADVHYDDYQGIWRNSIGHPLNFLGFAVSNPSNEIFGITFFRVRGFASEPSRLVCFFLLPAAMALTFQGAMRGAGVILMLGDMISFAGSAYLAFGLAVASLPILLLFRPRWLVVALPFTAFAMLIGYLAAGGLGVIAQFVGEVATEAGDFQVLSKENSANVRLALNLDMARQILTRPFGVEETVVWPLASLLNGAAQGGFLGAVLMIWIHVWFFQTTARIVAERRNRWNVRAGALLLYGTLFGGLLLNGTYLFSSSGFILLALLARRMECLAHAVRENSKPAPTVRRRVAGHARRAPDGGAWRRTRF